MPPLRFTSFVKQSTLIKNRLSALSTQTNTFATKEDALSDSDIAKLKAINDEADKKNNEFTVLLDRLFSSDDDEDKSLDVSEISQHQDAISDLHIQIHSQCVALISVSEPKLDHSVPSTHSSSNEAFHVRLPTLNLGTFSGQPEKWIAFHSLFQSTVHNSANLSDVEKFTYLLSCLSGEALNHIKSLPVTPENYDIAYDLLVKRYNNSRLLITLHINNIIDLPSMTNSTFKQLRSFICTLQENTRALTALGHDICNESLFLTSYILRKFDNEFRVKFEQGRLDSNKVPDINEFLQFLEKECSQLEAANFSHSRSNSHTPSQKNFVQGPRPQHSHAQTNRSHAHQTHNNRAPNERTALIASNSSNQQCAYCASHTHKIHACAGFMSLTSEERLKFVQGTSLCNNCLGKHNVRNCLSRRNCIICDKRHHSSLHIGNKPISGAQPHPSSPKTQPTQQPEKSNTTSALVGFSKATGRHQSVLLGTTLVQLASNDRTLTVRAVLDSAAQHTFISENCVRKLGATISTNSASQIFGISSTNVQTKGMFKVTISTLAGDELSTNHQVVILRSITNHLPTQKVDSSVREQVKHLVLGDPNFDTPAPVDLLIGADLFPYTLLGGSIFLGDGMPTALNTIFGYVLIGNAPVQAYPNSKSINLLTITNFELHNAVQQFWATENVPEASKTSPEEKLCESYFVQTHNRLEDGKYEVRLPLKQSTNVLGDSSKAALRIFKSLETRLNRTPELKRKYVEFMQDYEDKGHMVTSSSLTLPPEKPHYFLPHHEVLRDDKIRVVFNGSAVTTTGLSLNSILLPGEKLQNDIPDIIMGFRRHPVVFTCDIQQMFRNIWVHSDDQDLQLIYWRSDPQKPIQIYKLTTVTYGLASSPFLANRVVQQLIEDESQNHPLAAAALRNQIYVDDALLGSDSEEHALQLQTDVIELMAKGGFTLRKWSSNSAKLLSAVPHECQGTAIHFNNEEQATCNVLGIKWLPDKDAFTYKVSTPELPATKRLVLSTIARLYDPLGWITPVIFYAKSFLQVLWTKALQWDDKLSPEISSIWENFVQQLVLLQDIYIPRHVNTTDAKTIQLHGYSDASDAGFCATVFLRVQGNDDQVHTYLLIAKSRVAPLKRVSLPRLELCGAHLLSKLLQYCVKKLCTHLKFDEVYAWCDSTIVLSWIQTPAYRLKTYVANRVAEIQDVSTPINWRHIASEDNPADCGSRGLSPSHLISHPLWWTGPSWLKTPSTCWPSSTFIPSPETSLPDVKPILPTALHSAETKSSELLSRFSSWTKLTHVVAYIHRFVNNCRLKILLKGKNTVSHPSCDELPKTTHLSLQELDQATTTILRVVQLESFQKDIASLQSQKDLTPSLRHLSPFIDEKGLLRVGGRLSNSSLRYNAKHPILLPKQHHITELIIDYYHIRYLHCGQQQLQTLIIQKYWILSARSVIRSRIFKCIRCYRCKPRFSPPKMADLPESRVVPTRPFTISAVDFAGPFSAKLHNLRRLQHIKIYLCLFICMSTKAIHIEVAMDLTAECFIACLTRFISRRGQVTKLYSDNATNFTGAARKIRDTVQRLIEDDPTVKDYLLQQCITFHFIPPKAPHFGGLWERAIQSAKRHLRRVVGDQVLTVEEFTTLVCRIEAMLNSRPITPMSSDPSDLEVLTPGHFLTGGPLVSLPETSQSEPINRLKRWQLIHSFAQQIWKRWQTEYLHTLQNRPKWTQPQRNLKVDDLVLVQEDNVSPLQWKRGRVTKVIPGKDNVIRVAEVKTVSGVFTRPVVKLSLLPNE